MKTIKRRAFCKAAAAAVAGVLAPHAAAEALLPQAVVGSAVPEDYYSFAFRSDHSETDLSHDFYYTDAFFENTALQYSHKLALATLGLVAASGSTYQSDALYWVEGEAGREDSIADAYQKLGFANAVYVGYQCPLATGQAERSTTCSTVEPMSASSSDSSEEWWAMTMRSASFSRATLRIST